MRELTTEVRTRSKKRKFVSQPETEVRTRVHVVPHGDHLGEAGVEPLVQEAVAADVLQLHQRVHLKRQSFT